MERTSPQAVTSRGRLPFGLTVASLVVVMAAVSLLWQSGAAEVRVDDLARLSVLAHAHGLIGSLAASWTAFAAQSVRLAHLVFLAQLACGLLALWVGWVLLRSALCAAALAVVAVASPFVRDWAQRPLGISDVLAASALMIAFAAVLDTGTPSRGRTAVLSAAGAAAVLVSGWAAVPLLVLAAVHRCRADLVVVGGLLGALALRAALGFPLDAIAGPWSTYTTDALTALRLLVFAAVAAPAAVFVLTRPRIAAALAGYRAEFAVFSASLALMLAGGLSLCASAMFFAGGLGVVLAIGSLVTRTRFAPRLRDGLVATAALFVLVFGAALRAGAQPAAEPGRVARDRATVRSAGNTLTIVDHGRPADRARYSPMILGYLAGHALSIRYAEQPPAGAGGAVLDAGANGLTRIDTVMGLVAGLERARAHLRDDVYADRAHGRIQNSQHLALPPEQQAQPDFQAPAPTGPLGAIAVQSRFAFVIDGVHVQPGDRLVYLTAKASFVGDVARSTVTIDIPGRRPVVVTDDLSPAQSAITLTWRARSVAIPVARPQTVRITFAASSPSGTNIGDWVAYALPAVVPAPAGAL